MIRPPLIPGVRALQMTSGVHAIRRVGEQWISAAAPRREGIARGD